METTVQRRLVFRLPSANSVLRVTGGEGPQGQVCFQPWEESITFTEVFFLLHVTLVLTRSLLLAAIVAPFVITAVYQRFNYRHLWLWRELTADDEWRLYCGWGLEVGGAERWSYCIWQVVEEVAWQHMQVGLTDLGGMRSRSSSSGISSRR